MSGIKWTPGMGRPFADTGMTKCELMQESVDRAEPEYKLYTLTADIVYRIQYAMKK